MQVMNNDVVKMLNPRPAARERLARRRQRRGEA